VIVAGCDVGSLTAKAVIMRDREIVAYHIMRSTPQPELSARTVLQATLEKADLEAAAIDYCVGTGYGRNQIPFADAVESEIACHGRGAWWLLPSVRMVIDIGGQDAKAIRLDEKGNVIRYVYNDKCASGTGRFLEIMADALEVELEEMGSLSQQGEEGVSISNQCVVFAETEIISLVNEGKALPDIIMGLHAAMAHRVAALAKSIEIDRDVTMTGGVAKNGGMFRALERALGESIVPMPADPQINGALGAAVIGLQAGGKGW